MLDPQTMRLALGAVSLTVLILFYLGVYRPTRSGFAGWWSISLLCAAASTTLLLFNGSDVQVFTNPASNVMSTIGATCVWFATRSLRNRKLPRWLLGVAPLAILVPSFLQNPADNIWAGNGPLFVYMGVLFTAASAEVWLTWAGRRARVEQELNGEAVVSLLVSAIASSALGLFYLMRAGVFLVSGPDSELFATVASTAPTTGILLICLVAVTFSASAIGWDQQTQEMRQRAMHDDLTGLLGRTEFRMQAEKALDAARVHHNRLVLAVADLDHFKSVNDQHGHAAGDQALLAFADAVKESLAQGEIAGRLGGEEFGLILLDVDDATASARLGVISDAFAEKSQDFGFSLPTVSYGIAGLDDGHDISEIFERADLALYSAKGDGRNRAVKYTHEVGQRTGRLLSRRATDREIADQRDAAAQRHRHED